MFNLDPTWLQLLVALASFGFMAYFFRRMEKKTDATIAEFSPLAKQFTPVVKNVMSNMGKKSADSRALKETESLIAVDMKEGLLKLYPEIQWLLDMISPATMEKIEENPEVLPVLIERYGPTFMKLKGRLGLGDGQQRQKKFDF